MKSNLLRNAEKRFRQGRISLQKLQTIAHADHQRQFQEKLAQANEQAANLPVEELAVEEHVHGESCNHEH